MLKTTLIVPLLENVATPTHVPRGLSTVLVASLVNVSGTEKLKVSPVAIWCVAAVCSAQRTATTCSLAPLPHGRLAGELCFESTHPLPFGR